MSKERIGTLQAGNKFLSDLTASLSSFITSLRSSFISAIFPASMTAAVGRRQLLCLSSDEATERGCSRPCMGTLEAVYRLAFFACYVSVG